MIHVHIAVHVHVDTKLFDVWCAVYRVHVGFLTTGQLPQTQCLEFLYWNETCEMGYVNGTENNILDLSYLR